MNDKPKSARRRPGFFWYVLLFCASFAALGSIRLYFEPESLKAALIYAGVCATGIVLAIALAIALIRWMFCHRNFRWLLLAIACVVGLSSMFFDYEIDQEGMSVQTAIFTGLARSAVVVLFCALGIGFLRWLFHWRNLRWFLCLLAGIIILLASIYTEENWRGKHAWESYKRDWEAKGEKFEFLSYVPPPVPDIQNFALTPIVSSCYRGRLGNGGNSPLETVGDELDRPDNTNNRLNLRLERAASDAGRFFPTNTGEWKRGRLTDLASWQTYYRVTAFTNLEDANPVYPHRATSATSASSEPESPSIILLPLEFPIAPRPQSPAADVLLALSKFDPVIEELRTASRLPYARFPLRYDTANLVDILLPHLSSLKGCASVLRLRAIAELQLGQTEQALEDVKLTLRLVAAIREEPFLISQLVRMAMWQIVLQPVWEGLAEHRWSDIQLVELEKELQRLDFLSDYSLYSRCERAIAIGQIDYWRTHRNADPGVTEFLIYSICSRCVDALEDHIPEAFCDFMTPSIPGKLLKRAVKWLPPDGWYYQNDLILADCIRQRVLLLIDWEKRIIPVGATTNLDELSADLFKRSRSPYGCLAAWLTPQTTGTNIKFAHAQASADLARLACALERHRLAHGKYPDSTDSLAPQFIDQIPHDVIHGQPLKYRRLDNGEFALYSIGWNEKDDGGRVEGTYRRVDLEKGDWVWWSSTNLEKGFLLAPDTK